MTQPATRISRPSVAATARSRARRDQLICGAIAAVCLAGVLILQPTITRLRSGTRDASGKVTQAGLVPANESSVRQIAVDFPRLTLGGFRGFLAMELWRRSENAKNDRQWQELGTLYNVIAKIEPYFVSVYIFNAWNEAYNLSAQWHTIADKYRWVLLGLDHLYDGEYYNPSNPDLLYEVAQMYFMKIGTSFERIQYRELWRDNIAHQYELTDDEAARTSSPSGTNKNDVHRAVRSFILRPQFNAELATDPAGKDNRKGFGIRIKGLIKPEQADEDERKHDNSVAFPDGISPFYFAYKEYQRALAAGTFATTNVKVVDAYPAMSLRLWCRDDLYHATGLAARIFTGQGLSRTDRKSEQDEATTETPETAAAHYDYETPSGKAAFDQKVREIRRCYKNIAQIAGPKAIEEFEQHLIRYPDNHKVHDKHAMEVQFLMAIAKGESELFEALTVWHAADHRKTLSPPAREHLTKALAGYDEGIASIDSYLAKTYPDPANPDREDFVRYQQACRARQEGIRKWLTADPSRPPDLAFLRIATVER